MLVWLFFLPHQAAGASSARRSHALSRGRDIENQTSREKYTRRDREAVAANDAV
jgi:hypothetical protein